MTIVFNRPKRTWEEDYFGFDFATFPLPAGVTIESGTCDISVSETKDGSAIDATPASLKSGAVVATGTKAVQLLVGGVSGNRYLIQIKAVRSDGLKVQEDGLLWVIDPADE